MFGMPQNRRTQFICRRQLGWDRLTPLPVRKLKFMELRVETPPQRLDELTIRLKQIEAGRDSYNVAEWDEAGWTTVFHGTNVPLSTGQPSFCPTAGGPIWFASISPAASPTIPSITSPWTSA
jgi:hypothetical protein